MPVDHAFLGEPWGRDACDAKTVDPDGRSRTCGLRNQEHEAEAIDVGGTPGCAGGTAPLVTFDKLAADRLADEVAVLVRRHVIDSRSPAADALLDYRDPPSSPHADRLAELEGRQDRLEEANNRACEILMRAMLPGGAVDRTAVASAAGLLAAARLSTHPLPPATRAELDDAAARWRKELEGALRAAPHALPCASNTTTEGPFPTCRGDPPQTIRPRQPPDESLCDCWKARALAGASPASPDARVVLTELLRLYDWRFALAEREKDPRNAEKDFKTETRRLLQQYGAEKKSAWAAARRALAGAEEPTPKETTTAEVRGFEKARAEAIEIVDRMVGRDTRYEVIEALEALTPPAPSKTEVPQTQEET